MGLNANDLYTRKTVKSLQRARLFLELLKVDAINEDLLQMIELAESIVVSNGWKTKEELATAIQQACERLQSNTHQVVEEKSIFSDFLQGSESALDDEAQIIAANIYSRMLKSIQGYVRNRNFSHPTALQIKSQAENNLRGFLIGTSSSLIALESVSNQQARAISAAVE
jgi:hypothetical protein